MKKIISLIFILMIFSSFCLAQIVNGDTLTVQGKKILKIWGTHYERGYATGYLLGDKIKLISEDYFISYVYMSNAALYESRRNYFVDNFEIEDKYTQEAQGIIDGMIEAEIDLFSVVLQRDMDPVDVLMSNAIVDIIALGELNDDLEFGCSSLSSWGESTILDPELAGNLVITRNMDWMPHPALLDNHLLVVHFPSEVDEVNWASFTFPGMFGALSAINEDGLCAFMNMGNNNNYSNEEDLHPIFLSIRNGIEIYDYNGDYETNAEDIVDAVQDMLHLSGSIVHCANESYGLVIECNNVNGTEVRDDTENTVIPLYHLAATNHFRKLYPPASCYRYDNIADSLAENSNMDVHRSWNLLVGALNLIKWSTAEIGIPAYLQSPAEFNTEELFILNTSTHPELLSEISLVSTFPNPFYSIAKLSFSLPEATSVELSIYNIKGQKLTTLVNERKVRGEYTVTWNGLDDAGNSVVSGVYFYRFETEYKSESGRLILVK
jgi:hypothetical protein